MLLVAALAVSICVVQQVPNQYDHVLQRAQGMKWDIAFDVLDNDQRTPLHWAAYKGYVDTVRLLLAFDASPHLRDTSSGRTPLHWAAIRGHRDACTVLLQVRCAAPSRILPLSLWHAGLPCFCA